MVKQSFIYPVLPRIQTLSLQILWRILLFQSGTREQPELLYTWQQQTTNRNSCLYHTEQKEPHQTVTDSPKFLQFDKNVTRHFKVSWHDFHTKDLNITAFDFMFGGFTDNVC